jgi:hypothetical protein
MALYTYPAGLPKPLVDGYSNAPRNSVVRTSMDDGIARVRRRFTDRPITTVPARWVLTQSEYEVFDAFMTLRGYDWHNASLAGPSGIETVESRIVGDYTAGPAGGSVALWSVSAQLEVRQFTNGLTAEYLDALEAYSADDIAAAGPELAAWFTP